MRLFENNKHLVDTKIKEVISATRYCYDIVIDNADFLFDIEKTVLVITNKKVSLCIFPVDDAGVNYIEYKAILSADEVALLSKVNT